MTVNRLGGTMMASCECRPDLTRSEEAKMIRKIVAGQQDLFNELIVPHLRPLSSMVRASIGAHPDAEDIVQQASLKAFTHLTQFRFEASFRTWLIRIGLNEVRQWRRKQGSSPLKSLAFATLTELSAVDPAHSPLVECERNEAVGQLRVAVARLPEKYRQVLLLRDLEDLSISEVAGRLGLSIPGVKTRHLRARRKVARLLARPRQSPPRSSALR
jgi:RNA polymerase sigma-70 factor (ECF subfamily)